MSGLWVLVILIWSVEGTGYEYPTYGYAGSGQWLNPAMRCEEALIRLQSQPTFPSTAALYCVDGKYYRPQ